MKEKQRFFRLFSLISTLLLTTGIFFSNISSVSASNISSSSLNDSNHSLIVNSSSKLNNQVNSHGTTTPMLDEDSNTAGYIGSYQVTTIDKYNAMDESLANNGLVKHFSVNDDIGKCYCYDYDIPAPDQPGYNYNGFDFWQQMNDVAGKQKAAEVSQALMNGYHLNKDTGKWEVSQAFQQDAQESYNQFKDDMNQQNIMIPNKYSLDQFEQDCTQIAVWEIGGEQASDLQQGDYGRRLMGTNFVQDLVSYSQNHPLNQQTAEASGLTVESNGKQISANNPLTIDPTSLRSQNFEYSGYNGKIAALNLGSNIQIIDSQTNEAVSSLEPNHNYYLQAKTLNTANQKQNFDMSYEKVAESHFLSPVDLNATSSQAGNKYQNMVNLATKTMSLPISYVLTSVSSSESSTIASSSSVKNSVYSSAVKVLASSKASSKKSSSVISSSKASSKKSSVVSS